MATTNTLTMAQAVNLLKQAGVPYGGQAGSQLKNWESIASYVGANLLTSGGAGKATASPETSVSRKLSGDKIVTSVVDVKGKAIKGDTTFGTAGTTTGGGGGGTTTGGGGTGGAGSYTGDSGVGTKDTNVKDTQYGMREERRLSGLELAQYENYNLRMKGGRAAPTAALLAPYRGYGGPRSTQIGNPNTQTATKMLLGQ